MGRRIIKWSKRSITNRDKIAEWYLNEMGKQAEHSTKYSLSELKGIIALENDNWMSYDEMRMAYMKEKFSL